jgi:hypothetical protein
VRYVREGMVLPLRRSKTDQETAGELSAIAYGEHAESCPVRSLQIWPEAGGITTGQLS